MTDLGRKPGICPACKNVPIWRRRYGGWECRCGHFVPDDKPYSPWGKSWGRKEGS